MIVILILMMHVGLMYRSFFTLAMFYAAVLQKVLLKGNLQFLLTGLILGVFPSLPVVESEPRVAVV